MSRAIPIYTDHDERYAADTCRPLIEASNAGRIRMEILSHGHYPGEPLRPRVLHGLKMAGFWDAASDQDWGLNWHRNEGIELAFLERGRLDFATDEGEFRLRGDDLTIIRPWQRHRIGKPFVQSSRLHWILIDIGVRRPHQDWRWPQWVILSPPDLEELTIMLRRNEQTVWRATIEIRRRFQAIAKSIESRDTDFSRFCLDLNELLLLLLAMLRKREIGLDDGLTNSKRTVQLFLADLQAHPEHLELDWTVDKMAAACDLGVTQFISHAKSVVGMTPMQYLVCCRVELAARMLRDHLEIGITEVALRCGFSSSQYFATVFTRFHGCSPTAYRSNRAA